ncbi:MAG: hypothetical protein IT373_14225 [Polyangiaceae bacterium]|nr:hypothetical protein [Polyangiaceae bacterium]
MRRLVCLGALAAASGCTGPAVSPAGDGARRARPTIEQFEIRPERRPDGTFSVVATVSHGRGHAVVLYRGEEEVHRASVRAGDYEAFLPVTEPGEYRVVIEADGAVLGAERVQAAEVPCVRATRRLELHAVRPARIRWNEGGYVVELQRWSPSDRDDAYVVQWLHEGVEAFEGRGRLALFEQIADRMEANGGTGYVDAVCAFTFGERYPAPSSLLDRPGRWEVRIHHEGRRSIAAGFTVLPRYSESSPERHEIADTEGRRSADLDFAPIDTPADTAALLARMPSACRERCPAMATLRVGKPGTYDAAEVNDPKYRGGGCMEGTPVPGHLSHWHAPGTGDPLPLPFSREELRAMMRTPEVLELRAALNHTMDFGAALERPDFYRDPRLGAEDNAERRSAWSDRDTALQRLEESQKRALGMKQVPALRALVEQQGSAPWTDAETPRHPAEPSP